MGSSPTLGTFLLTFGKYSDYCINMRNIIPTEWTPHLAYVVGLITTDGNLSKDGRHIDLTSKDLDQVTTFSKLLGLNNKIGLKASGTFKNKKYYRVQFSNVHLYRFLLSIGLTPTKSKSLGELKIPDKYFADFLRGHLDGDGSIFTYQDKYNQYHGRIYVNTRVFLYFISVSYPHITWLHKKINELAQVNGSLQKRLSKNRNRMTMWTIKFAKKESTKLLKWIYYKPNLPALKRKLTLTKRILEIVSREKRKKYTKVVKI